MEYYYYRLPGVCENENYLNYHIIDEEVIISTKDPAGPFKTVFTEEDIREMTKDQRYLFSLCDIELYREGDDGYND